MAIAAVFTDLDGTLLDQGATLPPVARAAVCELRRRGIPVIPLASKTDIELREFLRELDLGGIGSFENGDVSFLIPGSQAVVDAQLAAAVPEARPAAFPGGRGGADAVRGLIGARP